MPLARISIKTALHLARGAVIMRRSLARPKHRARYSVKHSGRLIKAKLKYVRARELVRVERIRAALAYLEIEADEANAVALKARGNDRQWASIVSEHMERRSLVL